MNSQIILEIDYREKAIIKHIEEYKPDIKYNITNLPIGDFVFKEDNTISYIIERKTILDLAASITDGRFREQKQRLLESIGQPDKIVYILEGNKNQKKFGSISKSIIDSSILNLIFRHKYKVLHTLNDLETYDQLLSLYKKIASKELDKIVEQNVKLIKKGESVQNNILSHMLSTIPGVSMNIAKKIEEIYVTLPNLINSYDKLEDISIKESMLSSIIINGKRKLGNALSKKIYNSLYIKECNKKETGYIPTTSEVCLLD